MTPVGFCAYVLLPSEPRGIHVDKDSKQDIMAFLFDFDLIVFPIKWLFSDLTHTTCPASSIKIYRKCQFVLK